MKKIITVEVTVFIPPNGRKKLVRLVLPEKVKPGYEKIIQNGCRLTSETLQNGTISLTIEEPRLGDFVSRLVFSPTKAESTLTAMIETFDEETFIKWKNHQEQLM